MSHDPSLVPEPSPTPPSPPVDLGRAEDWATELAVVGALTTLGLGLVSSLPGATLAAALALTALVGAGLGAIVPRLLHRHVRRVPILVLVVAGVGLGACWGAPAGYLAARLTGAPWIRTTALLATATAFQLGWLWLPVVLERARGRSPWPWVLAACLASPLVGWLAVQHVTWSW